MTDFAMCAHETCPAKAYCRRNARAGTVPGNNYQSYATYEPQLAGGKFLECAGFMQVPLGKYPTKGRAR